MTEKGLNVPFVVGAYASQPQDDDGQRQYYDLLAQSGWVAGLEVPFPGQMRDSASRDFLGSLMQDRFVHSVVTAIPGTMVNVWDDPTFGLASPDQTGREKAMDFVRELNAAVLDMEGKFGHLFDAVALHSAPTNLCEPEFFEESLREIQSWNWNEAHIVIEHCDEKVLDGDPNGRDHQPEKGFLFLEDEVAIAKKLGLKVSLNWGRSAVGSRGDVAPNEHIRYVADSGVLAGVLFSGASPEETIYGPVWIDGHLPLSTDESASLMTPQQVIEGASLAHGAAYLGAKCCVPKDADLSQRLLMLHNIYDAAVTGFGR
ncbi:DUF4862 family protein [Corynebacterium aquilae]|uniref:DUF4862 domain-containing protein n=1 Tax=Corynebacterium aquilae DSM 44791 TaxID=1431546 RepID=A0A1L7CGI2_9CORY|nr:DUF4862 family protein [Corynebacterium aquilae]APT84972.1 hypothetical protein CAQU_07685 [Corynebacterium aquilae DSM 44791]